MDTPQVPALINLEGMPESQKKLQAQEKTQTLGDFLMWLQNQGYTIAKYRTDDGRYYPAHRPINEWLAEYFHIDLDKLEQERLALLKKIAGKQ